MTDAREAARALLAQLADSRACAEDVIFEAFRVREEEVAGEFTDRIEEVTERLNRIERAVQDEYGDDDDDVENQLWIIRKVDE